MKLTWHPLRLKKDEHGNVVATLEAADKGSKNGAVRIARSEDGKAVAFAHLHVKADDRYWHLTDLSFNSMGRYKSLAGAKRALAHAATARSGSRSQACA